MSIARYLAKLGSLVNSSGQVLAAGHADASVTTAKIADANVTVAKLSATGTPSATTYLRGDGSWTTPSGYAGPNYQLFAASGTFTVPAGVTSVKVTCIGAGGGASVGFGSQGGAGGCSSGVYTVTPGAAITVTVGTGGAGVGNSTNGAAGGASSFGALLSATGGGGAGNSVSGAAGVGSGGVFFNSNTQGGVVTIPPFFGRSSRVGTNANLLAAVAWSNTLADGSGKLVPGANGACWTYLCVGYASGGVNGAVMVQW